MRRKLLDNKSKDNRRQLSSYTKVRNLIEKHQNSPTQALGAVDLHTSRIGILGQLELLGLIYLTRFFYIFSPFSRVFKVLALKYVSPDCYT